MDIIIPAVGESVFEALVAKWHKGQGEAVRKDQVLCEIETDKITMEINAEADGVLRVTVPEGTTVRIGTVIGTIEETGIRDPRSGKAGGDIGATSGVAAAEKAPVSLPGGEGLRHVSPSERKAQREKAGIWQTCFPSWIRP